MEPTSFAKLKDSLTMLVHTYREAYRSAVLTELSEMTFRQFVYLDAILRMENPTYSEVAEKFKVSKPTVTAAVNKLINLGYVRREQSHSDRRIYYLTVSDKAKKLLESETDTATGFVASMQSCLTRDEQNQFIEIVKKVLTNYPSKKGQNSQANR